MTLNKLNENTELLAPVSAGELFDKITILRIKSARITDPIKLRNIDHELSALQSVAETVRPEPGLEDLVLQLQQVNEALWDIEDDIRAKEREQEFGQDFIRLARSVYQKNDKRAALKRQINLLCGSTYCEEKSYASY